MAANVENINLKKQRAAEISSRIGQMLEDIRFGSIEIVIHDGKVVQIERREKLRPEVFSN
ncbi:YezD family protein [Methylobacter sp.]|uniref:YezD family protein n=1 Tax=Methylobacter sp. TaxID=2051955 RepID=UPI003DA36A50